MAKDIKQVIVMRTKYPKPDGSVVKLRVGKLCAQAGHSVISFLTRRLQKDGKFYKIKLTENEEEWIESGFTKICVYVETEEELLEIFRKAKEKGLEVHLIKDSGKTEFGGVPTHTCLAIGPDESKKIDEITGHLKLL